jgi:flavin reductase (DIM6/NTAB) family NADH-FMN oxidoreductase RutF
MTANAFVSVSLDPPLILVSLDNRSNMHRILPSVRRFGISVLAEDQEPLSNHFAGRTVAGLHLRFVHRNGLPLIGGAVAYFVVEVIDIHPAGDHTLYISRVEHFEAARAIRCFSTPADIITCAKKKAGPTQWPQDEFSLFSIGSVDPPIVNLTSQRRGRGSMQKISPARQVPQTSRSLDRALPRCAR